MRHPTMLKSDSRLAESRQCLCEILRRWERFEPGSPSEQNDANTEEAAQTAHSPVGFVPGHGEHVENTVSDPTLPENASRCDACAASQDGGNRAEESMHTLQRHLPPLCAGPHGHTNLSIAMALYRIGRLRVRGGECGAIIGYWMCTCSLKGDYMIGALCSYRFLRSSKMTMEPECRSRLRL